MLRNLSLPSWLVGLVLFGLLLTNAAGQGTPVELPTSEVALLGRFHRGPMNLPVRVDEVGFQALFGSPTPTDWPAELQAREFFANGGGWLEVVRIDNTGPLAQALSGDESHLSGLHALSSLNDLQILIAPELSLLGAVDFGSVFAQVRAFLEPRRIFLILDPPPGLANAGSAITWVQTSLPNDASFCAVYFPYLRVIRDGVPLTVSPCGAMAAILVKVDAAEGIWSSPAGVDFPLQVSGLHPALSSGDTDNLNVNNINSIREFAGTGVVPWGARTLNRSDVENRFITVVRSRNWIAKSVERWLAFAAIQDNNDALWTSVRSGVESFFFSLYQQGALRGTTPSEAYFVRCDSSTVSQADIAAHRINTLYGLALLRPGEFDVTALSAMTHDPSRPLPRTLIHFNSYNDGLVMIYPTVPGFDYLLETSFSLVPGEWLPGGSQFYGNGTWQRAVVPMSAKRAFYAIHIEPGR